MRPLFPATVLVFFLAEVSVERCADAAPVPFPKPFATQLAGSYFRGAHHSNITLHFKADGSYTARLYTCVEAPFFTEGRWRVSGSVVVLKTAAKHPTSREIPQQLHLVRHNGGIVLVSDLEDKDYRQLGVTPRTAFHKQSPTTAERRIEPLHERPTRGR